MSQPEVMTWRWNWWTAGSVITVLGADVPEGSALTSWITGLARQPFGGTQGTLQDSLATATRGPLPPGRRMRAHLAAPASP